MRVKNVERNLGRSRAFYARSMKEEGFERAVREQKDRVHSYAFWMLRDRDEARDISQEALVRLWQHRNQVPDEAIRSWLLRTAHHLCVDRLRRRAVRSGPSLEDVTPMLRDRNPGPDKAAAAEETGRRIGDALRSLSSRDRAIVLMREVQGMAYDEIARALDLPLGTLKASLHRAREKLRRELIQAGVAP